VFIELGKRVELSAEFDAFLLNNNQFGGQQFVPIMNSGIEWALDSTDTWNISLTGYDLLNKAQTIDRVFFSNGFSETQQNTLTRFFMLSVSYGIRKGEKKPKRGRY